MTRRTFLTLVTMVTAPVAVTCVKDSEFTGPSTEQGNPQIVAVVVDGKSNPVRNALVSVYQVPSNTDTLNQPSAAILVATSATDCVGTCSFDKLIPGMYSLKASDADSSHATIKTNIPISAIKPDKPEYRDTLVLAVPGSMGGVVSRGGVAGTNQNQSLKDAFIQIKIGEIDRSTVSGPSGAYFFSNLPAGTYTVYYYATDGFYSAKRENIIVSTAHTTIIDTVVLVPVQRLAPPKGFRADYDTIGGTARFYWQKVTYPGLRYYTVERICLADSIYNKIFTTPDTSLVDSLTAVASGTVLDYVIRSVDTAFNRSQNAGPITITVIDKKP